MDKILTIEEAAERLKLNPQTVSRYCREGKIQAVKVGKAYRIRESALAEILGSGTAPTPPMALPPVQRSYILAVANQKGGVGKTTTTINLGAALAERGKRVLLIDLDPQFNCTQGVGIDITPETPTIAHVLQRSRNGDRTIPISATIRPTGITNLDIVPGSLDLAAAEIDLLSEVGGESRLRSALAEIASYDYIIIDCPPSLGRLTLNGLSAARGVIIPVQTGRWALMGTNQLLDTIDVVRNRLNDKLEILGVLCTMYDPRTNLSREVHSQLEDIFKNLMFKTIVRQTSKLGEAAIFDKPILTYDRTSQATEAYRDLAAEVESRCREVLK